MKKWVRILSMVICLFMVAGCAEPASEDNEENPFLTSVWQGYDEMPFAEFLERVSNEVSPELSGKIIKKSEVMAFGGWNGAEGYDENSVEEGKTPVTFSLNIEYTELDNSDETKKAEIIVYTKLDDKANTLEILGGSSSSDGEITLVNAEDTVYSLELAKNIVQGSSSDITDAQTNED